MDAGSSTLNPNFAVPGGTAATDYLPGQAFLMAATGTGITTDYAGSARSGSAPSMGAYEFVVNPNISLTATAGTATGGYSCLKNAFDAINAGTHQGNIEIKLNVSVLETVTAVLIGNSKTPAVA